MFIIQNLVICDNKVCALPSARSSSVCINLRHKSSLFTFTFTNPLQLNNRMRNTNICDTYIDLFLVDGVGQQHHFKRDYIDASVSWASNTHPSNSLWLTHYKYSHNTNRVWTLTVIFSGAALPLPTPLNHPRPLLLGMSGYSDFFCETTPEMPVAFITLTTYKHGSMCQRVAAFNYTVSFSVKLHFFNSDSPRENYLPHSSLVNTIKYCVRNSKSIGNISALHYSAL